MARKAPVILVVSHFLPYPVEHGNQLRLLKLLKHLKTEGYQVAFIYTGYDISLAAESYIKKKLVKELYWRQKTGFLRRLFKFGKPGLPAAAGEIKAEKNIKTLISKYFFDGGTEAHISGIIKKIKPDVMICEYVFMSPSLDLADRDCLKIIDTIDVFSDKTSETLACGDIIICTKEEESSYLSKADVIIAIQSREAVRLKELAPEKKIITVGVDFDLSRKAFHKDGASQTVLIVASSNSYNAAGLKQFIENAWPKITELCPAAVLRVAGRSAELAASRAKNIEIAGWKKDLKGEYERASIVVNPVKFGTGLKIKSVEALAYGKALVCWPYGAHGIAEDEKEKPYIACGSWDELADSAAALLKDPVKRMSLRKRASDFARRQFRSEKVYLPLMDAIEEHLGIS
ncbi:MAG: glycosyltransferase [Candidatus Margulisiibacteriota bacterium]